MSAELHLSPPFPDTLSKMSDTTASREAPKREEQVLVLAARGLTDKEIAIKLGISPDTVGTYWRRILAKYQAASRTEVVAKYASERSKAAVESLQYVNECLKLVADHMIEQAGKPAAHEGVSAADSILAVVSDWIILISPSGELLFSNKPVPKGCTLASLVDDIELDDVLSLAATMETDADLEVLNSAPTSLARSYTFRFWPGVGDLVDHIVGVGRSV
jgi:DNA-binding CsgD family transcriptional regulator